MIWNSSKSYTRKLSNSLFCKGYLTKLMSNSPIMENQINSGKWWYLVTFWEKNKKSGK